MKIYKQLSHEERTIIATLIKAGWSRRAIAEELQRAPSTISREINRNFSKDFSTVNLSLNAQRKSERRQRTSHKRPRLKNQFIRSYVNKKIILGWSPEQIAGRLNLDYPELKTNHESIYLYLFEEARYLLKFLTRKRRHRKSRKYTLKGRVHTIPNAISIELRDPAVLNRNQAGHWEVDTAYSSISGNSNSLLVVIERKTRFVKISKLKQRTAKLTRRALIRRLKSLPPELKRTLTFDNGKENAEHLIVSESLGVKTFFCRPYASYEKGSVENIIGVIRRVFPKGTNFDKVSHQQIRKLEALINSRPRKCLSYLTPEEAFKS